MSNTRADKSKKKAIVTSKTKKTATAKQTGGGGGVFEEKAIAYFLTNLLIGDAPLQYPRGKVIKVETQRPSAVWQLDDMLIKVEGPSGIQNVAFSIKSNRQITSNGFPADFVRTVWEQILQVQSAVFNPAKDYVGFITSPLGDKLSDSISTLLNRAQQQDSDTLAHDIAVPGAFSAQVRKLYNSIECPPDLATNLTATEAAASRALKCLIWLPFDLEANQSRIEIEAQNRLRSILVSGRAEEASQLWEALCTIGRDMRPHAGSRTQPQLVNELRYRFQLIMYPDHRADWSRIRKAAKSSIQRVAHLIGGQLELPRKEERIKLQKDLNQASVLVLHGPSGTGKSVLARMEALNSLEQGEPVIWIDAEELRGKNLMSISREWGLREDLETLLASNTAESGLCVIDRLDKVYDNTISVIAELLRLLCLSEYSTPWKVMIPCVVEEWERLQSKLMEYGVVPKLFKMYEVAIPALDEQEMVWFTFPQLASFRLRPHLNEVLLRPKLLDVLARSITLGQGLTEVVGETSVAKLWLISLEQQGGTIKQSIYAKNLATIQADTWQNSLPAHDLPELNNEVIEELVKQRVLIKRAGSVWFEHDLYGDWFRLEQLRTEAQKGNIITFLATQQRLTSPLWHRAIRLYGVALLDEHKNTMAWHQLYDKLETTPFKELGQNLLLEAIWYSADSVNHMLTLWPMLTANEGEVLQRFLMQFLQRATQPNQRVLALVAQDFPHLLNEAATLYRLPIVPYWLPMLEVIYKQRQVLPLLSWLQIAKITRTWLQVMPAGMVFRRETAELAVFLGEQYLKDKQGKDNLPHGLGKFIWPPVLLAAAEEPTEVAQILLEAAGRRSPRFITSSISQEHDRRFYQEFYGTPRPQWVDGPAQRVDDDLQKAVLNEVGIKNLLETNPAVAQELVLALLIEEPKSPRQDPFKGTFGLEDVSEWKGAHYQNGPFMDFFQYDEAIGVDLLLRLEKRAIEGWKEELEPNSHFNSGQQDSFQQFVAPSIWLDLPDGLREFVGDRTIYGWYRGAHPSTEVMTSALMALEKYLYDRLDANIDIVPLLNKLLHQAESVAVLGTLIQVGKYKPELLYGELRPLIGIPELLLWDQQLTWNINYLDGGVMSGILPSTSRRKLLYDWQSLPHRKISFRDIAIQWFIKFSDIRTFFGIAREQWRERLTKTTMPDFYETCFNQFNIENYEVTQISPDQYSYEYKEPPERQAAQEEWKRQKQIDDILFSVALKRNLLDQADAQELEDEQLEGFWKEVKFLEDLDESGQKISSSVSSPIDVMTAIAALFLTRGKTWLAKHQDRRAWCEELLLEGAQMIWEQQNPEMDENGGITGLNWQDFVSQLLPVLWAENTNDKMLRQAIGRTVLSAPTGSLKGFVKQVVLQRTKLGEDYLQAIHLLMLRARQWYQRIFPNGERPETQNAKALKVAEHTLKAEREEWLAQFINGSLSHTLPALHNLKVFIKPKPKRQRESAAYRRERPMFHTFNEEIMIAAYEGLPSPINEPVWLPYWRRVVADTLVRLQPASNEMNKELEGYPEKWDSWLFNQLANWIPSMEPTLAQQLWEPVLTLGPAAYNWVQRFLHDWTMVMFRDPNNKQGIQTWLNMAAFAQTSPNWNLNGGFLFHRNDLWRSLFALDWYSSWTSEQECLAKALCPALKNWASWASIDAGNVRALAIFLASEAAIQLRVDGLSWLEPARKKAVTKGHSWEEAADSLAALLSSIWDKDQNILRKNTAAFQTFQLLLAGLVARQHPMGFELSARVEAGKIK